MNAAPRSRAGVTLIEVAIATAVLTVIVSIAYMAFAAGSRAFSHENQKADSHERARRALEEIARELRIADADTLVVSPYKGADRVEFVLPRQGPDDSWSWTSRIQYRFEPNAGTKTTGNGNVLGRIVRIQDREVRTVCDNANPDSLTIKRLGNRTVIRLKLRQKNENGVARLTEVETTVTLRNRSGK